MRRKRAKRRKKRNPWLLFLLAVIFIAALVWINRAMITDLIKPAREANRARGVPEPSQEEILERERKDLNDILKRR